MLALKFASSRSGTDEKSNLKIANELVRLAKSLVADGGALDDAEGDRIEEKANIYLEYEQVSSVKVLFFASFDCDREALNDSGTKKLARDCEERIRNDIREINRQVKDALCDQGKPSFTSNFSGYANARVYVKGVGQIYADVNNSDDVKPICDVLRKLGYKEM